MWAELIITVNRDLPSNPGASLAKRFSHQIAAAEAIDLTVWQGNYDWVDQVVFAQRQHDFVFLVFAPQARTMKVHVESTIKKSSLFQLRRFVDELTETMSDYLRYNDNGIKRVKALIYAEGDHLQSGERPSRWERIRDGFRENFLVKLYIPVATFVATLLLGDDVEKALINVVAALVAVVLWVVGKAFLEKTEFRYGEA